MFLVPDTVHLANTAVASIAEVSSKCRSVPLSRLTPVHATRGSGCPIYVCVTRAYGTVGTMALDLFLSVNQSVTVESKRHRLDRVESFVTPYGIWERGL